MLCISMEIFSNVIMDLRNLRRLNFQNCSIKFIKILPPIRVELSQYFCWLWRWLIHFLEKISSIITPLRTFQMGYVRIVAMCVLLCTNQIYYVRIVAMCVLHAQTRFIMSGLLLCVCYTHKPDLLRQDCCDMCVVMHKPDLTWNLNWCNVNTLVNQHTPIDIDWWIGVNCISDEKFLNVLIPNNDSKSEWMLMWKVNDYTYIY